MCVSVYVCACACMRVWVSVCDRQSKAQYRRHRSFELLCPLSRPGSCVHAYVDIGRGFIMSWSLVAAFQLIVNITPTQHTQSPTHTHTHTHALNNNIPLSQLELKEYILPCMHSDPVDRHITVDRAYKRLSSILILSHLQ